MADQQHSITPPLELVAQIRKDALHGSRNRSDYELRMVHAAYRAGADAELEAILKIPEEPDLSEEDTYFDGITVAGIRENRRPKPPSLAEQALALISHDPENQPFLSEEGIATIRRALKRLQELENNG